MWSLGSPGVNGGGEVLKQNEEDFTSYEPINVIRWRNNKDSISSRLYNKQKQITPLGQNVTK